MSLRKALSKAKRTDEETAGFSFKMPVSLKNDFEKLCKKNKVTLTSMILASVENMVDEGKNDNIDESINSLQSTLINMNQMIEAGIDESDVGFDPKLIYKATKSKLEKM